MKTIIGEGTSAANHFKAHGLKVTAAEIQQANTHFNMDYSHYQFPDDIMQHFQTSIIDRGEQAYQAWKDTYHQYQQSHPQLIKAYEKAINDVYDKTA